MSDSKNILEEAKRRAAEAENNPNHADIARPRPQGTSSGRPEGGKPPRPMREIQRDLQEMADASAQHEARQAAAAAQPETSDGRIALEELSSEVKAEKERVEKLASSVIYQYTPLDNPECRAAVEARLEPLDFSELLTIGHVIQTVYLGKHLQVTYQSPTVKETSWIQHTSLSKYPLASQTALRNHWAGLATLTFAIHSVKGVIFPRNNGVNEDGLSEVNLEAKRLMVERLPDMVLTVIAINHGWFTDRVQKLFLNDFEELKNG